MEFTRLVASIFVIAGIVTACSGGGGDGGGGATDSSSFASEYCQILAPCCGKVGYPTDGTTCRNYITQGAQGREYDAAQGSQCLSGLHTESARADFCDDINAPPACKSVFKKPGGGAAPGAACEQDNDCAASTEGEIDCLSRYANGATTKTCQVRVRGKAGDDCTGTVDGNSTSSSYTGDGPPPPKVTYCYTADNLTCDITGSIGSTKKCIAIQNVGGPCSSTNQCVKTAYCDITAKQCVARIADGGDCSGFDAAQGCNAKSACDTTTKKCTPRLADDAPCQRSEQCASSSCVNGKCAKNGLQDLAYLLICGPKSGG